MHSKIIWFRRAVGGIYHFQFLCAGLKKRLKRHVFIEEVVYNRKRGEPQNNYVIQNPYFFTVDFVRGFRLDNNAYKIYEHIPAKSKTTFFKHSEVNKEILGRQFASRT